MPTTTLKGYFTLHLNIDEKEIAAIVDQCIIKKVRKGQFLLRKNEICTHTFFVEEGLLRQFSIDQKGKEHIIAFGPENWFVTDRESAFFHRPSAYFIQALEDSQVAMIDEGFGQLLSSKFPEFTAFNNRLLHNHIRHLQNRINMLLSAPAEERYLEFIKMYPNIFSRVPQTMVASYLGITPESLSRVRKEVAQKVAGR